MKLALRLLLVCSVLYGTGAHWAALQSVAWAKMAVAGETAPCDMCRMVDKGAAPVKSPAAVKSVPHADLAFVSVLRMHAVLPEVPAMLKRPPVPLSVDSEPSVPPPKSVLLA